MAAHKEAQAVRESLRRPFDRAQDSPAREYEEEGGSGSGPEEEGQRGAIASPGEREAMKALQMRRQELAKALELAQQGRNDEEVLDALGHSS